MCQIWEDGALLLLYFDFLCTFTHVLSFPPSLLFLNPHSQVMEGHKEMFNNQLVTIWSAPNYCYRCGNVAAILEFDERCVQSFKIFEAAPQEVRGVPQKNPAPDYFL